MASISKTFKTELLAYILADATVAGLIGTRLFALRAEQNATTPFVVWQDISGEGIYAHDGPTGLRTFRIQFSIYAPTVTQTEDVAAAIVNRIDGYSGVLNSAVRIGFTFFDNDVSFDHELDSEGLRQRSIDFRFMASAP